MLFLLFSVFTASEFKISHLNALLRFRDPNSARNPHFTLSAEGGCMNWTSLNTNIVTVKPNYDNKHCSTSARVEVVATGPNRKSTSILVEHESGQTLKCDVFVDSVASVSILTTTRSIYIESSLETLYLQALDSGKNIFTSLEGTDIDWKIDRDHLRIIDPSKAKISTQSSSSISHPKSSAQLIIQGTKVGKTWASATLDNNLNSQVDLTVVEPIALDPPIVRVLPYTHISYKLCSTRGNAENEVGKLCSSRINLPDEQHYRIEVTDQNIATTDQSAYVSVNGIGSVTVIAVDQQMNDNTASSRIISSYPSRVIQDEQYIALGDRPNFNPRLFDKDGKDYDFNYFEPIKWDIIGDWSTVGRKEITLKYHDFTFIAIVHVCPPLKINPEKAILPINYNNFPLTVTGGSGYYSYKVENSQILDFVNQHVNTHHYGISRIIFNDEKIAKYSISAEIEVSRIGLIDIKLEYRETLDKPFQPTCEVFATENRKFSVDMPHKLHSSNLNIVLDDMRPNSPGFADIYCESGEGKSEYIKVSVASKLSAEVNGIASPNSKIPLKINGGVKRWPFSDRDPTIKIDCPNTKTQVENNQFSVDREFSGVCTLTMQNEQTSQNPHPLLLSTNLNLRIHKVDRFAMHFIDLSNQNAIDSRCNYPLSRINDPKVAKENYNISLNRQYRIYVFAIDANNDIIKYYSADRFNIQSTAPQNEILPTSQQITENELSTQFLITPRQATKLTIVPLVNPNTKANSLVLNTVSDFSIQGSNHLYFHSGKNYEYSIIGGSGLFETNHPNTYFKESQLFFNANSAGNYKIDITDVCNPNYHKDIIIELIDVYTLRIEAPSVVAYNIEFEATVKAFDKNGQPIPQSMYEEANIHLSNTNAQKISYNTWRLNSSTNEKLTLTAAAENGVTATHIVDVVLSIVISPQYIELLPGETQRVYVKCGPTNINFDDGLGNIASIKEINSQTYEIIAISPGNVTIKATARNIEGLPSFPIYVHVIKPIDLKITPSSDHVVQYGKLMLSVVMNTDAGPHFISNAKWDIPNDFTYDMINNSLVVIHCSEPKNLLVSVSAYGLSGSYSISVEPKLKLKSPQEIYLPTQCSYKILVENDLDCQYSSLASSIVTIDGNNKGIIQSTENEGDAIVVVKFGHQFLTLNIKVSNPRQFYITQVPSSNLDYEFIVLNPEGYQYTTDKCLKYELSTLGKDNNNIQAEAIQSQNGRVLSLSSHSISFDQPILISASVSNLLNQQISLRNTFYLASSNSISPKNPIFLQGYGKQMQCSIQNPYWFTADKSIASVTSQGFVQAKKVGTTQISCGNGISTIIKVLDIKGIQIQQQQTNSNDRSVEYKIDFVLSDSSLMSSHDNVIKPNDLKIECDLDEESKLYGCGKIVQKGEDYFVFSPNGNKVCPRKAKIIVTAHSSSIGLYKKSESQIPVLNRQVESEQNDDYSDDFAVKRLRCTVSKDQPNCEVPVNVDPYTTTIRPDNGLTAHLTNDGYLSISADNNFGPSGEVILINQRNSEKIAIKVIGKTPYNYRVSSFKKRQFSLSGNEPYYVTTILIILGIVYLIAYLCF